MPFVQVADLHIDSQLLQQPPAADAQHQFLEQTLLLAGRVEVGRYASIPGAVERVIAVEQVQVHLSHAGVPDSQVERSPRQFQSHAGPAAVRIEDRRHRQASWIVEGECLHLPAVVGQHLAEVALLVKQADAEYGHVQIAGAFQVIARQNAQATRIDRQGLGKPKFHAEIPNPLEFRRRILLAEPTGALHIHLLPFEPRSSSRMRTVSAAASSRIFCGASCKIM